MEEIWNLQRLIFGCICIKEWISFEELWLLFVNEALWIEIWTLFLHDICTLVQTYNIPDGLVINVDQTPSKYVPTSSVTMAEKNSKHVQKQGADVKHAIKLTLAETLSQDMLPFRMIYIQVKQATHYQLPILLKASY